MKNLESKADRTRQFIIEAAAGIFNTKGYAGTSLSDLTQATGLTKGSIYGNFTDKEEVALACFDYNLARLNELISAEMAKVRSFEAKLLVYTQVYQLFVINSFPAAGGCPILNTATEADDTNPRLKERVSSAVLAWQKRIVNLIEGGMANGEFRQDAQPRQIALSIIALIEGGTMIAQATNDPASLSLVLKTVKLLITQLKA
jgi:TetR/AcrR family transcriptional regulator, transcriptional repressor for nem operon